MKKKNLYFFTNLNIRPFVRVPTICPTPYKREYFPRPIDGDADVIFACEADDISKRMRQ